MRFYKYSILLLILAATQRINAQQWNPDAGIINPYKARVTVSSGMGKEKITDGNPGSYWQSDNPLPNGWISRLGLNAMLNTGNFTASPKGNYYQAFDGNTDTKSEIINGYLELKFKKELPVKIFSVKINSSDTVFIDFYLKGSITGTLKISPANNYRLLSFKDIGAIDNLVFRSKERFSLFEAALLDIAPYEYVVFDFGRKRNTGWIAGRWFNDNVETVEIYYAGENKHWKLLKSLNPKAVAYTHIPLEKPVEARYIKVVFTLPTEDYRKAQLWEMEFYDRYGPYGKPPAAQPSQLIWKETFGINTIWGWGYNVYSDLLPKGTGAGLFIQAAKEVRSYHRLDWDIQSPRKTIDFNNMATAGTQANKWLNWDREYGNWKQHGFDIDVTLMFNNSTFPDTLWKDTYAESYSYAKAFANHFVNGKHLISAIEIGNEPWEYSKTVYREIIKGMSEGIRSESRNVTILPCAVQAFNKYSDNNDYISGYIIPEIIPLLSGLNTHIYNYVFNEAGNRVAVRPEDPKAAVWSVNNLRRYIDYNDLEKDIYVTEFGYDSDGGNETCTHSECVSELQQAAYGVRMAMILWRLGVKKMFWYYFANVDYDSFMHNRSGLTSSYRNKFQKKKSFNTFKKLLQIIGNYRFEDILTENGEVYAYILKNPESGKKIIIAWRPVSEINEFKTVLLPLATVPDNIIPLIGNNKPETKITGNKLAINLSGMPVVLIFE